MGRGQVQPGPPSAAVLTAITERGRLLAGYDQAAWHATDAVQMANPKTAEGQHYLARVQNGKWMVVFGSLNADKTKFLIHYEALQGEKPQQFHVTRDEPPKEDTGFYLFAARALVNALSDFGHLSRPYQGAVLPAEGNQLYVYLYPAQIKAGVFPLGGDVRYLASSDGNAILEKREMHKTILETRVPQGGKPTFGLHSHIQSDLPEDSDVLHVLQQDPAVPERITTQHFVYEIAADGSIRVKPEKKK